MFLELKSVQSSRQVLHKSSMSSRKVCSLHGRHSIGHNGLRTGDSCAFVKIICLPKRMINIRIILMRTEMCTIAPSALCVPRMANIVLLKRTPEGENPLCTDS